MNTDYTKNMTNTYLLHLLFDNTFFVTYAASMKDDPSTLETPSVKHVSSEELPSLEHDSFKEKLLRRQRARGESACEICLIDAPLDAVHLFDSSNREALEKLYYSDNHNFPVCTNDSTNGILLCGPCHSAFVSQDGLLQIDIDGDIIAKKGCGPASDRNGMKIAWSDRIGKNGYPSAVFLATVFAMQSSSAFLFKKRGLGVEIQGQDDEEGEGEGEEVK